MTADVTKCDFAQSHSIAPQDHRMAIELISAQSSGKMRSGNVDFGSGTSTARRLVVNLTRSG